MVSTGTPKSKSPQKKRKSLAADVDIREVTPKNGKCTPKRQKTPKSKLKGSGETPISLGKRNGASEELHTEHTKRDNLSRKTPLKDKHKTPKGNATPKSKNTERVLTGTPSLSVLNTSSGIVKTPKAKKPKPQNESPVKSATPKGTPFTKVKTPKESKSEKKLTSRTPNKTFSTPKATEFTKVKTPKERKGEKTVTPSVITKSQKKKPQTPKGFKSALGHTRRKQIEDFKTPQHQKIGKAGGKRKTPKSAPSSFVKRKKLAEEIDDELSDDDFEQLLGHMKEKFKDKKVQESDDEEFDDEDEDEYDDDDTDDDDEDTDDEEDDDSDDDDSDDDEDDNDDDELEDELEESEQDDEDDDELEDEDMEGSEDDDDQLESESEDGEDIDDQSLGDDDSSEDHLLEDSSDEEQNDSKERDDEVEKSKGKALVRKKPKSQKTEDKQTSHPKILTLRPPLEGVPKLDMKGQVHKTSLYFKKMPPDVSAEEIKALSKDILAVFTFRRTNANKSQRGYLYFKDKRTTDKNLQHLRTQKIRGKSVLVHNWQPHTIAINRKYNLYKLFVTGFDRSKISVEKLKEWFPKANEVELPRRHNLKERCGYAFATFRSEVVAKKTMEKMDQQMKEGRILTVRYAKLKKKTDLKHSQHFIRDRKRRKRSTHKKGPSNRNTKN